MQYIQGQGLDAVLAKVQRRATARRPGPLEQDRLVSAANGDQQAPRLLADALGRRPLPTEEARLFGR